MPEDEVIVDAFQPLLFEVWRWLPLMPRPCEGTLRGTVKCRASSTTESKHRNVHEMRKNLCTTFVVPEENNERRRKADCFNGCPHKD
ncbi:hypothetical protein AVEN_205232-1 [Araneus ventricosus]|uniref:Uncharacterized protein n=1 Tax=Araneus ventricosus TaxID=182803 RepID=A0A4Y2IEE8_ARAVE|nr:hypothetical protein AVEN_205232-1 [Araneus ventricosus]